MLLRIDVKDTLLKRALEVMLSDMGYALTEDADDCQYVVTDCVDCAPRESKALYVLREKIDDLPCLVRPFSTEELDEAMKKLSNTASDKKTSNGIHIDKKRLTVSLGGTKVQLTEKEFLLFVLLYENKGKTVSDSEIVSTVWKNETVQGSNVAAVYVNYLRKKLDERLGRKMICRVRGQGYTLKINEKDL